MNNGSALKLIMPLVTLVTAALALSLLRRPEAAITSRRRARSLVHVEPAKFPPRNAPKTESKRTDSPSEVLVHDWKGILHGVQTRVRRDRVLAIAAGVTFYALLAIFPAVAALVAIYSLFADPSIIRQQLDSLAGVLPGGAISVLGDEISRIATQRHATLGPRRSSVSQSPCGAPTPVSRRCSTRLTLFISRTSGVVS